MEMIDIMYELANAKSSLEIAAKQIRMLKRKCFYKNVVILGLGWFGVTACNLLNESDKKRVAAEEHCRELETQLAHEQNQKGTGEAPKKDICCDGKASIDKKEV